MSGMNGAMAEGLSAAEAMLEGELLSFSPKGKAGNMALAEGLMAKAAVSTARAALEAAWKKRVDMALFLSIVGALDRGDYPSREEALSDYNVAADARASFFGGGDGPFPLDEGEFEALRAIAAPME